MADGRRGIEGSVEVVPDGSSGWRVRRRRADAAALLAPPAPSGGRTAVLCRPLAEALVIGSAQGVPAPPGTGVAQVPVLRRRSGGAAVLVAPGAQCWLDVFLPPDDPLVDVDVARTAWWLGEVWAAALTGFLGHDAHLGVHRGPSERNKWSARACFGALGPGEVTLDGRKLVGISQRRASSGVWLHSMGLLCFDAARLAAMLCEDREEERELADHLSHLAASLFPPGSSGGAAVLDRACADLEAALVAQLPPLAAAGREDAGGRTGGEADVQPDPDRRPPARC
jgi:lipoate-protein ligase A